MKCHEYKESKGAEVSIFREELRKLYKIYGDIGTMIPI
jgi:hypothetical protein